MIFKRKKKIELPDNDKWKYYTQKTTALIAGGWEVDEDTNWYTDFKKDNTNIILHLFLLPTLGIGNVIYYYLALQKKRVLKPIK